MIVGIERGSTRSHSVENSLCKMLWSCSNTDKRMMMMMMMMLITMVMMTMMKFYSSQNIIQVIN